MEKITVQKAVEMIDNTHGQFFTVEFIKKDGTLRQMTCRLGVKKGVKGVGLKYDPKSYGLIPVYDVNNGFRQINTKTLISLSVNKQKFQIEDGNK